ncbi:MAG: response regulator transcription factor, partial [Peptococcaceae bacterium]|nr:response regulator transcription factor [Peptococcaceae bacterium]
MEEKRILFADDDPEIRDALHLLLTCEGYETIEASCGKEVLEKMDHTIDLVILDVMMPEMNGYAVCAELRKRYTVPILFLTAKSQDSDKTLGFSAGGDDYLVKPFSYNELMNRVKAILRRYYVYGAKTAEQSSVIYCCGNIEIDMSRCQIKVDGEEVILTDIEYRILLLLASHPQRIYSAQSIYEIVWNEPYTYSSNNNVMVHIRNIRRKLGDDPQNCHTIR